MPRFVNVTFKNDTTSQHVYSITDDVLGQQVVTDQPLDADETVPVQLVADENNHGKATYGFRGGVSTRVDDLNEGDVVNMS
jgi:hypothetical protein